MQIFGVGCFVRISKPPFSLIGPNNFAQLDLTAGLAGLDPLQLALVRAARTPDDPNLITEAHRLGLRVPRARLKFQEAFDQVAKNLGVT